jgi:hypothetical protein
MPAAGFKVGGVFLSPACATLPFRRSLQASHLGARLTPLTFQKTLLKKQV